MGVAATQSDLDGMWQSLSVVLKVALSHVVAK